MKTKSFFVLFCTLLLAVSLSGQTGSNKKNGEISTSMSKTDNRMTSKSVDETLKGIQVETKSVTEIISTAAVCKYAVKLKEPSIFKEQGICWSKSPAPETTGSKISVTGYDDTVVNGEMTDLESNTKYYVRAYVITTAGTVYGKELSFKTLSGNVNSEYWIRRR